MIKRVSRSAINTRKQCEMKRYLQYELRGSGVVPKSSIGGSLAAVRGQLFHEISSNIIQGATTEEWKDKLSHDSQSIGLTPLDHALVRRAMLGWQHVRGDWWRENFDVLSAEVEWSWPLSKTIHQPLRMDKIVRRKSDGCLGIFDYKTMGGVTPNWVQRMENSDQTHLYIQALKERSGEWVLGICYDGVIIGKEYKGVHKSPFVSGYRKNGVVRAEWVAGSSHEDLVGFSDDKWLEWILKHDGLLQELYCTTEFLNPFPQVLLHTKEASARAEEEWKYRVDLIEDIRSTYGERSPEYQQALTVVEKNPDVCLRYGVGHACPFVLQCWQGFPVEDDFSPRIDHHDDNDMEE